MRIAFFGIRGIPARNGGFDTVVSHLAPRLVKMGHTVTVFCQSKYSDPAKPALYQGVRLIYVPTIYGKTTETVIHEMLCSLLCLVSRPYDIYYVCGCRTSVAYLPHWLLRRQLVINTDGRDWERRKWGRIARRYLKASYCIARATASRLVSDSKAIQLFYRERYRRDTCYLTYGADEPACSRPEIVRSYGLEPRDYFLVLCRIEPENNVDLIVREFVGTSAKQTLAIVGGVNYRSRYLESLKKTTDCRIKFLGPIYESGHAEQLYLHCCAYIHGHEVGGTNPSLLNAMACGNVVLAHDVVYNREVLDGNGIFWTKNPGDLAGRIEDAAVNHAAHRAVFQSKIIARIRSHYTWDKCAEGHARLFSKLVAGDSGY
jgi:glycosyltransferase involved in cell wall biosynthesis